MSKRKAEQAVERIAKRSMKAMAFVTGGSAGKQLRAQQRLAKVKKFGGKSESTPEVKFLDTNINVNPTSTGAVALLNGCAEGTDSVNRIGRKIEQTSIEYDAYWAASPIDLATLASYSEAADMLRVSLVYDRQSNSAAPLWSDIYDQSGSIVTPLAHRNINTLDRFEVLATDVLTISQSGPNVEKIHRYVKTSHDTRFNGNNSGGVGDITSGAFFLVFADQNSTASALSNLVVRARVRFHDM